MREDNRTIASLIRRIGLLREEVRLATRDAKDARERARYSEWLLRSRDGRQGAKP